MSRGGSELRISLLIVASKSKRGCVAPWLSDGTDYFAALFDSGICAKEPALHFPKGQRNKDK
jgi:hypothetical protein